MFRLARCRAIRPCRSFHTTRYLNALRPFLLADIGEGIKECEVIQWFVEPGAKIEEFDPICEVQSDKASVEITSRFDGVIKKLYYEPGQMAHVGKPLVDIDVNDDSAAAAQEQEVPVEEATKPAKSATEEKIESVAEQAEFKPKSSEETVAAHQNGTTLATLATPAVRRICRELNIDIASVKGTGKDGRVMKEDVLNFSKAAEAPVSSEPAPSAQPTPSAAPPSAEEKIMPLTPIQKQMFKTMTNSLSIPHFLYTDEVNMDRLIQLRKAINDDLKAQGGPVAKVSFMPFFIKALSLSLNKYPILNSRVTFQDGKPMLLHRPVHNIGIAMDTPQGLIVPNIKDVASKSLIEVAGELQRLQQLGAQGKLGPADLKGGTITLSNIGNVGGAYVAPVIVDSEVAIVGLGKSKVLPRYDEEMNVVPQTILNTSWSGDHRVVDGMTMARMVDQWKRYVEHPEKMLVQLR
uniref:Dihydrolipoamide acetyltransferase component of pyruvate dehydrogenase complex n=1 Tax=Blastobotrys adeninivorans TaxID=409370 RepID=A0A060SX06_BLAAD